jgi:hypothetical protein
MRSIYRSFWPLILGQTVILPAMSNYFLSYTQIIGPWPMTDTQTETLKHSRKIAESENKQQVKKNPKVYNERKLICCDLYKYTWYWLQGRQNEGFG